MGDAELKIFVNSSANSIHIFRVVLMTKKLQEVLSPNNESPENCTSIIVFPTYESPRLDRFLLRLLRRMGRRGDRTWNIGVRKLLVANRHTGETRVVRELRRNLLFSRRGSLFDIANFRPRRDAEISARFNLKWIENPVRRRIRIQISSWLWLLKVFVDHRFSPRRVKSDFRDISYKGIVVGDLALAQALRYHPKSGGCIRQVRGYFTALRLATIECELALANGNEKKTFLVPGERTYLSWIYVRMMAHRGNVIITSDPFGQISLTTAEEAERESGKVFRYEVNDKLLVEAAVLLQQRTVGGDPTVRWGTGSDHELKSRFWPRPLVTTAELTELKSQKLAVVFLHSFNDGVFFYGVDDFDGYFGWAETAITSLLEVGVDQVLVKPHPNAVLKSHPLRGRTCDWHGQRKLLRIFSSEQRVSLCSSLLTPSDFLRLERTLFVSHSSNVVPELAFSEKCVLSSTFSPWGDRFRFSHLYSTRSELFEKAREIVTCEDFASPPEGRSEAIRFVASQATQNQFGKLLDPSPLLSAGMNAYGFEVHDELRIRGMLATDWFSLLSDWS